MRFLFTLVLISICLLEIRSLNLQSELSNMRSSRSRRQAESKKPATSISAAPLPDSPSPASPPSPPASPPAAPPASPAAAPPASPAAAPPAATPASPPAVPPASPPASPPSLPPASPPAAPPPPPPPPSAAESASAPRQLTSGSVTAYALPAGSEIIVSDIKTTFSCDGRIYGYYADVDNNCQIFHVCVPHQDLENGLDEMIQYSFFCGNQTIFDQEALVCNYLDDAFPCSEAASFYDQVNRNFGIIDNPTR